MARGPKKHMKRIAAPSHWMLDKLSGIYAPRPSTGPHKLRECLPLCLLLRNRLKYALTYTEVKTILMQRLVQVDGRVRTDHCYPAGFMDVITIEKTKEHFRLLYNTKGKFVPHRIGDEEAKYKLCRVKRVIVGSKGIPTAITHDGRTIRYIHPEVKANNTLRLNLEDGKVIEHISFESGNICMITGGHNVGRVGILQHREKHPGGFDIVHIRDSKGHNFATRISNVFVIGKGSKSYVSLPKDEGIRLNVLEDRALRLTKHQITA